jgi:hypothetical protein
MEGVRPLGGFAFFFRTAAECIAHPDSLDHQHFFLDYDVALGVCLEPALAGVDPARLQRAPQGPRESAGCGRHDVVQRRRPLGKLPCGRAVMRANLVVCTKDHRRGLCGEIRLAKRAALANDSDS